MTPIHILHVDDSEGDILLIREAIEEGGIAHTLDVARNGYEALQFLNKVEQYKDKATPDLILLDINMPVMNGHELLECIKTDDKLKHLPVIMLSTSSSPMDILKSYQKYCNCYIIKPDSAGALDKVIRDIGNFWTSVGELPRNPIHQY